jgi:hypothetical protein
LPLAALSGGKPDGVHGIVGADDVNRREDITDAGVCVQGV